jgi:RNA polymerase sigma factor (sigma-70 family)
MILAKSPRPRLAPNGPYFVYDPSFEEPEAQANYGQSSDSPTTDFSLTFMPDEVTRDTTQRMHYAAWRAREARTEREAGRWRQRYYSCRDRIVVGNRKLIYRAVKKWGAAAQFADDLIGDCQIVMIQAVAAYNPWMGIRFSTYAFTCLMRALSRLSQRIAADRLGKALTLDCLPDGEPRDAGEEEPVIGSRCQRLDEYLRDEHPLLTPREKIILIRRFCLGETGCATGTLEQVGRELGLSKERVRQVQAAALGKLRGALVEPMPIS